MHFRPLLSIKEGQASFPNEDKLSLAPCSKDKA